MSIIKEACATVEDAAIIIKSAGTRDPYIFIPIN
jgi:hypothetical protein